MMPPDGVFVPNLVPLVERARLAFQRGRTAAAEQLCLEMLDLAPGRLVGLEILYRLRRAQNRLQAAETLLRRLVRLQPGDPAMTCELALLLVRKGDLTGAEILARGAMRIVPNHVASHNLLGTILRESNRLEESEYHYLRVLELTGNRDPIVLANLAWNLKLQGRIVEARVLYKESAAAAPHVLQTLLDWARVEEADRKFDIAADLLVRAQAVQPRNAGLRLARAVLRRRTKRYNRALAMSGWSCAANTC